MKAAVLTGYDKNGRMLELRDVPVPEMKDNDVLVKIRAAGVNPLDNMIIRGEVKMVVPYSFPLVMGNEFVGMVEKVGRSAKKFQPGDRVYGRMELKRSGAFAEYAAVGQGAMARVPEYLSDEEAASVMPYINDKASCLLLDEHDDIVAFVRRVVLAGDDPRKAQRDAFAAREVCVNHPHAAAGVVDAVVKGIKQEEVK